MSKENLVEKAMLEMKQIEELIAENAKGILASTMKEEINSLVKESLMSEQMVPPVMGEPETEDEVETTGDEMDEPEMSDMEEPDMVDMEDDEEEEIDVEDEEDVLDLTGASEEALLTVFKAMKDDDGIEVKKTGGDIHLKDSNADVEYLLKLKESIKKRRLAESEVDEEYYDPLEDNYRKRLDKAEEDFASKYYKDEYDIEDENEDETNDLDDMDDYDPSEEFGFEEGDEFDETIFEIEMDEEDDEINEMKTETNEGLSEKGVETVKKWCDDMGCREAAQKLIDIVLRKMIGGLSTSDLPDTATLADGLDEIEGLLMDEEYQMAFEEAKNTANAMLEDEGFIMEEEDEEEDDMDEAYHLDEEDEDMDEAYDMDEEEDMDEESLHEMKKVKPKGVGMGSPSKFKFKPKPNQKGFDEKMKEGPKSKGTGKPKFEYKEGKNMDGKPKKVHKKKMETKEAAKVFGFGSKEGRGLRKGVTPNRNYVYETQIVELKEKNEEYRKALNLFREKINEVAVFNSNLAYATRLFTEHSTTKKEKINILRRFDDVQTLKESKSLYNLIKNELNENASKQITESVVPKINNTASTGSAVNLIESTTYENPQFLRMKDLMNKLTKK